MAHVLGVEDLDNALSTLARNQAKVALYLMEFVREGKCVSPKHIKAVVCLLHDGFKLNNQLISEEFAVNRLDQVCPGGSAGWRAYGLLFAVIQDIVSEVNVPNLISPTCKFVYGYKALSGEVRLGLMSPSGASRSLDDALNFVRHDGLDWYQAIECAKRRYNQNRLASADADNMSSTALGTINTTMFEQVDGTAASYAQQARTRLKERRDKEGQRISKAVRANIAKLAPRIKGKKVRFSSRSPTPNATSTTTRRSVIVKRHSRNIRTRSKSLSGTPKPQPTRTRTPAPESTSKGQGKTTPTKKG